MSSATAQPAKVKEAKPAGVSVDANADSGARAAREEYHNLGVEIPLRVADDSVVNEDEMIAWLDMLYAGHPSAQAALYRELADDTSDRYTTSGNERAMQTLRNTKGVRKDVLHLDEWVIFHTVDNDWLCSGRCRGPRWIYKHRKILLYRGLMLRLFRLGVWSFMLTAMIAVGTSFAFTALFAVISRTYSKLPAGQALESATGALLSQDCVRYSLPPLDSGATADYCFVPLYGTLVTTVVALWLLLAGTPYVKWTTHRVVLSTPMYAPDSYDSAKGRCSGNVDGGCSTQSWLCSCLCGSKRNSRKGWRLRRWNWCHRPYFEHLEIRMEHFVDVALSQGCLQRCLDVGDLCITYYAGEHGDGERREMVVADVPNITFVFDAVSHQMNANEHLRSNRTGAPHNTAVGNGAVKRQSGVQGKKHLI